MRRGLWGPLAASDQRRSHSAVQGLAFPLPPWQGRPWPSPALSTADAAPHQPPPGTQWGRSPDPRRLPDRKLRQHRREVTSIGSRLVLHAADDGSAVTPRLPNRASSCAAARIRGVRGHAGPYRSQCASLSGHRRLLPTPGRSRTTSSVARRESTASVRASEQCRLGRRLERAGQMARQAACRARSPRPSPAFVQWWRFRFRPA